MYNENIRHLSSVDSSIGFIYENEIVRRGATIMLTEYICAAMHQATYDLLPEGEDYFGEIPVLPGVWANGATLELCREELRHALEGWIVLGLRLGHTLPVINGIDLNAPIVAETH
jgi:predicted RNase H-like HicB family nuclease